MGALCCSFDGEAAGEVREKESAEFVQTQHELLEVTATVERAMPVLDKDESKGAALLQVKDGAPSPLQAVQAITRHVPESGHISSKVGGMGNQMHFNPMGGMGGMGNNPMMGMGGMGKGGKQGKGGMPNMPTNVPMDPQMMGMGAMGKGMPNMNMPSAMGKGGMPNMPMPMGMGMTRPPMTQMRMMGPGQHAALAAARPLAREQELKLREQMHVPLDLQVQPKQVENRSTSTSPPSPVLEADSSEQSRISECQGSSALPVDWGRAWCEEYQEWYYFNEVTQESQWERPTVAKVSQIFAEDEEVSEEHERMIRVFAASMAVDCLCIPEDDQLYSAEDFIVQVVLNFFDRNRAARVIQQRWKAKMQDSKPDNLMPLMPDDPTSSHERPAVHFPEASDLEEEQNSPGLRVPQTRMPSAGCFGGLCRLLLLS